MPDDGLDYEFRLRLFGEIVRARLQLRVGREPLDDPYAEYAEQFAELLQNRQDVAIAYDDVHAETYVYVPNQIVATPDRVEDVVRAARKDSDAADYDESSVEGVVLITFKDRVPVPQLVNHVRSSPDESEHVGGDVAPNHVMIGQQHIRGWPDGPPLNVPAADGRAVDERALEEAERIFASAEQRESAPITVAVVDTGLASDAALAQDSGVVSSAGDVDGLDQMPADGLLDLEGGHGTFVAGIVRRMAPGARIQMVKALDPSGIGNCFDVSAALFRCAEADIVNLSLGMWSSQNLPPLALGRTLINLNRRNPRQAIVAAAGNVGTSRPMWPAAFKEVLAVAAVDGDSKAGPEGKAKASFSNYGWWVDCCAPGVGIVSQFLNGHPGLGSPAGYDGYAKWSGTSFAAPFVSGRIAQRMAAAGISARAAAFEMVRGPNAVPRSDQLGVEIS